MKNFADKIKALLCRHPQSKLLLAAAVGFIMIGALDYWTGAEFSFSIFYLLPIAFVCWNFGRWPGHVTSLLAAMAWLIADLLSGHFYSHPSLAAWAGLVHFGFFAVTNELLSRIRASHSQMEIYATTDFLTGVHNVKSFYDEGRLELERMRRHHRPLSVAFIDLDNFKVVNDSLGHDAGDDLLKVVAKILQHHVRVTDLIGRLGGDEFAILFPETDVKTGKSIVANVHQLLLSAMVDGGWVVTFSIGLATFLTPPETMTEVVRTADRLMYQAKQAGKNQIYSEIFSKRIRRTEEQQQFLTFS